MSIVARMQLAMAVIEQFGFESVCEVNVKCAGVTILLDENAEFFKAATNFEERSLGENSSFAARMETVINGVTLVAYRLKSETSVAS